VKKESDGEARRRDLSGMLETMSNPSQELSPPAVLMQLLSGSMVAQAVSTAAELNIADHMTGGAKTAEEIARSVPVHAPSLHRLMRALAMVGVFVEHDGERFTLTPVGECLRSDVPGSQRSMAVMLGRPWRMATLGELPHCVRTGEGAFSKIFGEGVFGWFAKHPEEGAIFNGAMTSGSAPTSDGVAKSYDFSAFKRIAEIGGGHGLLLAAILRAHPTTQGVLFDLPHVAEGARRTLEEAGVLARAEIVGGSFFDAVPTGCDAYVMKHIIHDWDDARCTTILSRCREAMNPDGKVLVVDSVVPGRGVPSFAKLLDLQMLMTTEGGKERTEREFAELFAKAELRLTRIVPTPFRVSIIEATRA
jgi:hypothetical protein